MNRILSILLFIPFLLVACNSDDDNVDIPEANTPNISIEGVYLYAISDPNGNPLGKHTYISFLPDYTYSIYKSPSPAISGYNTASNINEIRSGTYEIKDSLMILNDQGISYKNKIVLTDSTLIIKESDYIPASTYNKIDANNNPLSSNFFISIWEYNDDESESNRLIFRDKDHFTSLYGNKFVEGTYKIEKDRLVITIDNETQSYIIDFRDDELSFKGNRSNKFSFLEGLYTRSSEWETNEWRADLKGTWVSQMQDENIKHIFLDSNKNFKTIIYSPDTSTPTKYNVTDSISNIYYLASYETWGLNNISLEDPSSTPSFPVNPLNFDNYIWDISNDVFIMMPDFNMMPAEKGDLKSEYYIKASDESSTPLFNAIMGSWKMEVHTDSSTTTTNSSYSINFEPTLKLISTLSDNLSRSNLRTGLRNTETGSYKFENNKLIIGESSYSVEINNNQLTISLVNGPEYFKYTGTFTKN